MVNRQTDYSRIAERYDNNPLRHEIAPEPLISGLGEGSHILDVACGTGNWIVAQRHHAPGLPVRWIGIDASPEMLAVAGAKLADVELILARAEEIPLTTGSIRLAASNFAYHHFDDRDAVFTEIRRVLEPGATLVMTNVCPEHMDDWWVYQFFPSTRRIDAERFPTIGDLANTLRSIGFEVETTTTVRSAEWPAIPILAEACNRDVSQLTLIDENEYLAGVEEIRKKATITGSVALARTVATAPR